MNPPSRPRMNPAPQLGDFTEHPATIIIRAVEQLYECAFRTDPAQHVHLMEQAHTAPQVLTDAIHQLFYLRREVRLEAARAADAELADSQRPFAAAAADQVAAEANGEGNQATRQRGNQATGNPQSPRPPTRDELVADISLLHRLLADAEKRLDDVALLTRLAAGTCQQLSKADTLGVLGLAHAVIHRQPATRQSGNQATRLKVDS